MALFTSDRERRLWLWALVVVVAIYATLALSQTLAGIVRNEALIGGLFWLGLILVGAAVVVQGLKRRPGGAEIGVMLGIAGAYLIAFIRMTIPVERSHLIEYSVLALFIYEALTERVSQGRRVPVRALLAIVATALIGVLDECIQLVLPSRVFDPIDILFNFIAAVMAVVGSVALRWARRWGSRKGQSR